MKAKKLAGFVVLSLLFIGLAVLLFSTDYIDFAGFCKVWLCEVESSHEYNLYKGDDVGGMGIINFRDFALWPEHELGGGEDGIIYIEIDDDKTVVYPAYANFYFTASSHWTSWRGVRFYLDGEVVNPVWSLGWKPVEPFQKVKVWNLEPGTVYTAQIAGTACQHSPPYHWEYSNMIWFVTPE